MKILVVSGSPKGEYSITFQTMLYIQALFPDNEYEFIHAGQRIKQLEKDFSEAKEKLEWAELIVFCYPVYTFLVPSQLHRFIELMKESGIDFSLKYATQISTSKHFYDTTAHEFIRENCMDMGLGYIRGLPADMDDLLSKKGQNDAKAFFHHVLWAAKRDNREAPICKSSVSSGQQATVEYITDKNASANSDKRVVIVADYSEEDKALKSMIQRFCQALTYQTEVVNIHDFEFSGGCLGCFKCASTGVCIYKDGFGNLLRDKIQTADATVYAFKIKDHSMGYRFKVYDDRQFCNGHRTVTMGKPVGYLIDGQLSKEDNLRTLIEARAQVGSNYLAGIATNESLEGSLLAEPASKKMVDVQIDVLADEMEYAISRKYNQPANFYGVGGMKIFRDLIYKMRGLMREDHRFYKEHGFYDFPQKDKGTIIGMYLVGTLMNSSFSKKHADMMTTGMMMPYKKIIDKVNNSQSKKS